MFDILFATDCVTYVMGYEHIEWTPLPMYQINHPDSPFGLMQEVVEGVRQIVRENSVTEFYRHFETYSGMNKYIFHLMCMKHRNLLINNFSDMNLLFYCVELCTFAGLAYVRNVELAPYFAIYNICREMSYFRNQRMFSDITYRTWQNYLQNLDFFIPR